MLRRLVDSTPGHAQLFSTLRLLRMGPPSDGEHIFVLGPPRSGTTLVQCILRHHGAICGPDSETYFFIRRRIDRLELDEMPHETWSCLRAEANSRIELFDLAAQWYRDEEGGTFFMEKTAEHALRLAWMLSHFPRAKFLFVLRDGRDAQASAAKFKGVPPGPLSAYPGIWMACIDNLLAYQSHPNLYVMRYEELCEEPERVMRAAVRHLGLPWQPHLLDPQVYSQSSSAASANFKRLAEPISPATVGIHRQPAFREITEAFERQARRQLSAMGYLG